VRGDLHLHPGDAGVRLHLTFITSSAHYTVSVGVPTFLVRGDVYFWGSLMGACLIASLPIAILYNFFVDRFVAGFTMGAIK
jgi:multiple sugar transport system permease protein